MYFVFIVKAELEDKSCNSSFIQWLTRLILSILRISQATDYPTCLHLYLNQAQYIWYNDADKQKRVASLN